MCLENTKSDIYPPGASNSRAVVYFACEGTVAIPQSLSTAGSRNYVPFFKFWFPVSIWVSLCVVCNFYFWPTLSNLSQFVRAVSRMYFKIHTFDCLIKPEEVCIFVREIWAGCVFLDTHFSGFDFGFSPILAVVFGFCQNRKSVYFKIHGLNYWRKPHKIYGQKNQTQRNLCIGLRLVISLLTEYRLHGV